MQDDRPNVDAAKERNKIEEEQEGHQPPHQSGYHGGFEAVRSNFQSSFRYPNRGNQLRRARIRPQPELVPNVIDDLGRSLPDIDHYRAFWFFEIRHLAGQN